MSPPSVEAKTAVETRSRPRDQTLGGLHWGSEVYCSRLKFRVFARVSSFSITAYDLTRGNLLP